MISIKKNPEKLSKLRVGTSTDALEDGELMVDSIEVRSDDNGAGVRIIGGKTLELLNSNSNTNCAIKNTGGDAVAEMTLQAAAVDKVKLNATEVDVRNANFRIIGTGTAAKPIQFLNLNNSTNCDIINSGADTVATLSFKVAGAEKMQLNSNGLALSAGYLSFPTESALVISGGAVTLNSSSAEIDTEGSAASDDLDTINGGVDGCIVVLRISNSSRSVVFKDTTGNMLLAGDFTANSTHDTLTLKKVGSYFFEMSRSNNM